MFPDPTLVCRPYPSILDGIHFPLIDDCGLYRHVLNLRYEGGPKGARRYFGLKIPVVCYAGFEDVFYADIRHCKEGLPNTSPSRIMEVVESSLLRNHELPWLENIHHFIFLAEDFCFETLGPSEPELWEFGSEAEALAWNPEPTTCEI